VADWFLLFTFLPIVLSFYYSLCDYSLLQKPLYTGLDNYRALAADPCILEVADQHRLLCFDGVARGMLVSLGFGAAAQCRCKGQAIYRTIFFLPSLVPAVASAMLWLWLFNAKLGLFNVLLGKIGISGPQWLASQEWAMPALALMSLWGVGNTGCDLPGRFAGCAARTV
jgi:multiple sugar transport system permease protein